MARPPGSAIGRYQILDFIARGETTIVYQAREPESGDMVALKILPPSVARDREEVNRFLRQADGLARLNHASILPILDYGREGGVPFVAISYAEGGALAAKMAAFRDESAALSLVAALAGALDYAHQNGFIHGRLEPAHVLLDAQDAPLLTGFGRPYNASVGGRPPAYVAPEQSQGLTTDGRTDIYQLGALLYELLLGHVPEPDPDLAAGSGDAGLSDDIRAKLAMALASAPEDRFQRAGDLLQTLNEALQRQVLVASQPATSPTELLSTEELPKELVPQEPSADEPQTADSAPALPAPAESAPEHAERPPHRDRNQFWLVVAVVGLVIVLTLCCILSIFALFELNDRLREPMATAQVDTNVRSGPAFEYEIVGLLREGEQAAVYGVSPDGRWWQIAFDAGPGGVGWVPAAFVIVDQTGNVDVVPPPTLTPFPAAFSVRPDVTGFNRPSCRFC
ncbi:MAG: protein kinase [Chloroflexota bacterium]|nr:MAG: protein kinase [Chloroflexota bacterium]